MNKKNGGNVTADVVYVSPKTASTWLESNNSNRNLRPSWVKVLRQRIRDGEWELTGDTVKFDDTGELIDGQHRLHAIAAAGKTVPVLVVRGVGSEAKYKTDTGAKRNGADALVLDGFDGKWARTTAAACNYLWRYKLRGHVNTDRSPSNVEIRDTLREHPGIMDSVQATKAGRTRSLWGSHSIFAFCHYVFSRQDPELADEFMQGLLTGIGLASEEDPVWLLRTRLLKEATKKAKISRSYTAALTFKAWDLWTSGESRQLLRVRRRGPSSEGFPDIGTVPGITPEMQES